jgi:hypothetical protein
MAGSAVMFVLTRMATKIVVSILVEAFVAKGGHRGISDDSQHIS